MSKELKETKICPVCQRAFSNRKKWHSRGQWPDIVYCSERCRKEKDKPGSDTST